MKTGTPADGLPDGLLLFDGVCVFCSNWVRWVIRRDADGLYRFTPMQSDEGRALCTRLGIDADRPQSHVVIREGRALSKSDAGIAVLSSLPGWRWTRIMAAVPRSLRDWAYDRIARNRYALFGKTDVCWIPEPRERERFSS